MEKVLDMDGNELKVGDIVLFATRSGTIARAKITEIYKHRWLKLYTLKKRYSTQSPENVLLDKEYK